MEDQPLTILLVVGTGGFSHAVPVLELGRILHDRGYQIEFATHQTQEQWVETPYYSFVSEVHAMGPRMPADVEDRHYFEMQNSDMRKDFGAVFKPKHTVDAFWTSDYAYLKDTIIPKCNPAFIVADFFVDAVKDINHQLGIPFCHVWPQMPYGFCSVPYIPGIPGFQVDALSSEHASIWTRLRAELRPLRALPAILRYLRFVKNMRKASGVFYAIPIFNKPSWLILVNSFWGLEVPKELPPLVAAVGPILPEQYPPLDEAFGEFLASRPKVVYIAFGSHIRILPPELAKFIEALSLLLREGLIDGVIWAVNAPQRKLFNRDEQVPGEDFNVGTMLDGKHRAWMFTPFAPQRAILEHPHTVLFISHGGGSSANEALYHGTPLLVLGFFFDQPLNALRLTDAGVALTLDKAGFTTAEIVSKIRQILEDKLGLFAKDVARMQKITQASSRKKQHACDLIEEMMWDHHFSVEPSPTENGPKRRRPMHFQTADMRMSAWKARNWDLAAVSLVGSCIVVGVGVAVSMGAWARRVPSLPTSWYLKS
ncbi:UDP-glucosyl transferase family protein [Lindgomyces ingoldianus]|uniref:UDP-glucosyl transferase family protein n=1 Tax=Lindgomyces ingoldianus TaxID=673940 RepID=A0ACB6QZA9_9PLEO|nr:UDP-glucosyl transferase family protein [Lindgomyces ingoldianus]KAF2472399.1 UDP-glucosyl transferase family protein [Lindgomyces ingoldianus]